MGEEEEGQSGEQGDMKEFADSEEKALTLEAKLIQAEALANDYYLRLQRLQADFDNHRKRTLKEKEETVKYAAERVIEAMLPVLDNFERAIASTQTTQDFAGFAQGVEMILRQMENVLTKEGLKEIKAYGELFDPKLHEAVLQVDSEEHPANTVLEELQRGYYLKDKVLRPSMVKVSR
ncbi:MAG: nucleotide exchange factor GrpE [Desulfitobacteriaceae bacterium]